MRFLNKVPGVVTIKKKTPDLQYFRDFLEGKVKEY